MLRARPNDRAAFVYAFDLLELDGEDLRAQAIEDRKSRFARPHRNARPGSAYLEHGEGDGPTVFRAACHMVLKDIASERKGSGYISGRGIEWRALKNPACEAVRLEQQENGQDRATPLTGCARNPWRVSSSMREAPPWRTAEPRKVSVRIVKGLKH